eukprot:CAMPEP_0172472268 /NCGR_PEP_ID=MMETSP1065-20121228/68245_1 /TAXON_ID=265537 /ORGANISM="Amphiprora paludosa, Strain CCMP125" /LENGTH=497 /DNA_ID=CAMNT_0013230399 /DNA_START=29 /DNA_END=1522 /DNA_ORIENTATION=+
MVEASPMTRRRRRSQAGSHVVTEATMASPGGTFFSRTSLCLFLMLGAHAPLIQAKEEPNKIVDSTRPELNTTGLSWSEIQQLHVTLDTSPPHEEGYVPYSFVNYFQARTEDYIFDNMRALGYDTELDDNAETCRIWRESEYKYQKDWYVNQIFDDLHTYRQELQTYYDTVANFTLTDSQGTEIRDVRKYLTPTNKDVCQRLHMKPPKTSKGKSSLLRGKTGRRIKQKFLQNKKQKGANTLQETFFPKGQLSYVANSYGWIEPLLPPLRHPNLCFHKQGDPETLDALTLNYLVHDFATMCQGLQSTSRIVLVDLGASPKFWELASPIWELVRLYETFGFKFDHIYAFEKKSSTQDTGSIGPLTTIQNYARGGDESVEKIYSRVPQHLHAAYHWIHTAMSIEPNHPLNPFTWIEQEFTPQDMVLIKMDIGPSHHEFALIQQLLNSTKLLNLVDHLYWEHKVHVHETSRHWGGQMMGSVKDSLELFAQLREKGVSAHYWV